MKKLLHLIIITAFISTFLPAQTLRAEEAILPAVGSMVSLSASFDPILMQGVRVDPKDPLKIDFIIDTGDSSVEFNSPQFSREAENLIKYFLASLTIP